MCEACMWAFSKNLMMDLVVIQYQLQGVLFT